MDRPLRCIPFPKQVRRKHCSINFISQYYCTPDAHVNMRIFSVFPTNASSVSFAVAAVTILLTVFTLDVYGGIANTASPSSVRQWGPWSHCVFVAPTTPRRLRPHTPLRAGGGFGGGSTPRRKSGGGKIKASRKKKGKGEGKSESASPYVKSETDALLQANELASASSPIGRAVEEARASAAASGSEVDEFYEFMPALIQAKYAHVPSEELTRVAGFFRHAVDPDGMPLEDDIIRDAMRPHQEIHAYMPGLGKRIPFLHTGKVQLTAVLEENYDTILAEYGALLKDEGVRNRFQSVTSMNYEAGWKTLVLFYNGHRIPDFPYHLCPITTKLLETVPLAGRIAGFNRQNPQTGIPLHSDGNNMWLTCQMGVKVPKGEKAWIRVGHETRHWKEGSCLLYDTTFEHETFNESQDEERVVLHIDFFNTVAMTKIEIEIMQYIYAMREEYLKAEGQIKAGVL